MSGCGPACGYCGRCSLAWEAEHEPCEFCGSFACERDCQETLEAAATDEDGRYERARDDDERRTA